MAAAHLLGAIGQERVFWKLRTMGLTYGPHVKPVLEEWMDFLLVIVPVNNAKGTQVLPILKETVKSMADANITDEEFERARGDALGALARIDEDAQQLALSLATTSRVAYLSPDVVDYLRRMPKADYQQIASPWVREDASINFLFGRSRARKKTVHREEGETP